MAAIVVSALVGTGFVGLRSGNGSGGTQAADLGVAPGSTHGAGGLRSVVPGGLRELGNSFNDPAKRASRSMTVDKCRAARKGLRWYRGWFFHWTSKMGVPFDTVIRSSACPQYLAKVFRQKAHAARKAYDRWYVYHYHWWEWLPANWQALGACETGYGKRPGNFEHSNSRFTSAFGISWAEYDADAAYFGSPPWHVRHTPRDQYNAARGHLARFGDGWTCPGP